MWVAGEMNLTMGRSVERAGGKVREEGREEERERGREKGKEGKGVVDRGRVRKGGREEEEGWEDAIKPYKNETVQPSVCQCQFQYYHK